MTTDKTAADRLRCFLSTEMESEGATDDTPLFDAVGYDLTYGDLHEVLRERDQLAATIGVIRMLATESTTEDADLLRRALLDQIDRTTTPQRAADGPVAPSGQSEPSHTSSSPQRGSGDVPAGESQTFDDYSRPHAEH